MVAQQEVMPSGMGPEGGKRLAVFGASATSCSVLKHRLGKPESTCRVRSPCKLRAIRTRQKIASFAAFRWKCAPESGQIGPKGPGRSVR